MENDDEYMTVAEAAKYMGVSRQCAYVTLHNAGLTQYRPQISRGNSVLRYKKSDIDAAMNTFVEVSSKGASNEGMG